MERGCHQRVLISGSSGFIGSALCDFLEHSGYEVFRLVRTKEQACSEKNIFWNPQENMIDQKRLEDVKPDIIIHLAGENIMGLWTQSKMNEIKESRTRGKNLSFHSFRPLSVLTLSLIRDTTAV